MPALAVVSAALGTVITQLGTQIVTLATGGNTLTLDLIARLGQKRAREVWYTCRQYGAAQAYDWGLVNQVVPLADLELETVQWCREILQLSPLALRMLKASHNAADDGLAGVQQLAGDATLLFYMTEEAQHGRDAYKDKRRPNFRQFPKRP